MKNTVSSKLGFIILSLIIWVIMLMTGGIDSIFSIIMVELICYSSFRNGIKTSVLFSVWCSFLLLLTPFALHTNFSLNENHLLVYFVVYILSGLFFGSGNEYFIRSQENLNKNLLTLVKSLVTTMEAKSPLTYKHSERVAFYCAKIGQELNLDKLDLSRLECASLLHDIGKIAIPDSILEKPSKLNEEEFNLMKSHAQRGYELIKKVEITNDISKIILCHHEKYDGTGYPNKYRGTEIPFLSRIISVADTFDVMTSQRPYNTPLDLVSALNELIQCRGSQFDPSIVDALIKVIHKDSEIKNLIEYKTA